MTRWSILIPAVFLAMFPVSPSSAASPIVRDGGTLELAARASQSRDKLIVNRAQILDGPDGIVFCELRAATCR